MSRSREPIDRRWMAYRLRLERQNLRQYPEYAAIIKPAIDGLRRVLKRAKIAKRYGWAGEEGACAISGRWGLWEPVPKGGYYAEMFDGREWLVGRTPERI